MATCVDYAGSHYLRSFNGQPVQSTERISLRPLLESESWKGYKAQYPKVAGKLRALLEAWEKRINVLTEAELVALRKAQQPPAR
jgi:hypothetical protein